MISRSRDILLIFVIGVALLIALEMLTRLILPQDYRTISLNGLATARNDSVLGHLNQPGAHVRLDAPEFSVEYIVNDEGFRDEVNHSRPKQDSILRILLLGDSFTWGAGVGYDGIWPVVFEHRCLADGVPVDVIKAGVSGYDTRQELIYLERLLPKYRPDIVILAFLPNDLVTNLPITGNDSLESRQALTQDSLLVRNQGIKDSPLHVVTLLKRLLMSNDFLYTKLYFNTDRSQYFSAPMADLLKDQITITKELLARALSSCRSHNATFIVYSIPQQIQVLVKARNYHPPGIDVDFIDQEFSTFARDSSFAWIPALPALVERYRFNHKDLFFRLNGHLSREGNAAVGDYLYLRFTELRSTQ